MVQKSGENNAINSGVFEKNETVINWDEEYYHPIAIAYYDVAVREMFQEMGISPGDQVLDAGCGPGVHSIRAACYGCTVTSIDLSSTMLSHARARAKAAGVSDRINFRQADITEPDLGSVFDYVFSWGVIIHVPDTKAALDGLASLIAPGGKLALHVLNATSLDYRIERLLRTLLGRPFKEAVPTEFGPGNWYTVNGERLWVLRFDMKALDVAMKERGFKLRSRRTAEFSELQRRLRGVLRWPLLYVNSALYRLRAKSSLSATQIIIYEREG